jgi:hypothetical protein
MAEQDDGYDDRALRLAGEVRCCSAGRIKDAEMDAETAPYLAAELRAAHARGVEEGRATAERARADGKAEGYLLGLRDGRVGERSAVVAWLRRGIPDAGHLVDARQRGEHVASAPAASAEEKCPRCCGSGGFSIGSQHYACDDCGGTGRKGGDRG